MERPARSNGPVALFIGTGILVSYYGLLLIASWVRARLLKREMGRAKGAARPLEPQHARHPDKTGLTSAATRWRGWFVATAIVSMIAFLVWFAFFAGAPFPNSPG